MTYQGLLTVLVRNANISGPDAAAVVRYYQKIKVLRYNAHDGYRVTHGAFFDRNGGSGETLTIEQSALDAMVA